MVVARPLHDRQGATERRGRQHTGLHPLDVVLRFRLHGKLRDSRSTSGMFMALVGVNTLAPLGASGDTEVVSHSMAVAEVSALEYGVRSEGLLAQDFWDIDSPCYHTICSPRRCLLQTS